MGGNIPIFPALLAVSCMILFMGNQVNNVGAEKGSKSMSEHKVTKRDAYGYGSYTPPAYPPPSAYPAQAPAYPTYSAPAPTYAAPAPTYAAPAPTYAAPAPTYAAPAPTYTAPVAYPTYTAPTYATPVPYPVPYYAYPSYYPPSYSGNSNYNSSSDPCASCPKCTQPALEDCQSSQQTSDCFCTKTKSPTGCTPKQCGPSDDPNTGSKFTCLCNPPGSATPSGCVNPPGGAANCNSNTQPPPCSCTEDKHPSGCQLKPCESGDTPSNDFNCICTPDQNPSGCVSAPQTVVVLNSGAANLLNLATISGDGGAQPLTAALGQTQLLGTSNKDTQANVDLLPTTQGVLGNDALAGLPLDSLLALDALGDNKALAGGLPLDGLLGGNPLEGNGLPLATLLSANVANGLPLNDVASGSGNPLNSVTDGGLLSAFLL